MSKIKSYFINKTKTYFLTEITLKIYPLGVWLQNPKLHYQRNQKLGTNLIFNGYVYKREASFRNTTNWVCSKGNGKRLSENKCRARCITSEKEGALKLGKFEHNHGPIKLEYLETE